MPGHSFFLRHIKDLPNYFFKTGIMKPTVLAFLCFVTLNISDFVKKTSDVFLICLDKIEE